MTIGLIGWRGDRLRAPGRIDSPLSREGAFLFNNLFFAVFAFAVLLGTVWPLIVEAVNGEQLSVGRPWFDFFGMVLGLCLLGLMADRAGAAVAQDHGRDAGQAAAVAGVDRRRRRRVRGARRRPRAWPRSPPSASAASPPDRRCARSCSPPAARVGGASSVAPTAA